MSKLDRKHDLNPLDDSFHTAVSHAATWTERYWRLIAGAVVGLLFIAGASIAYSIYANNQRVIHNDTYQAALKVLDAPIDTTGASATDTAASDPKKMTFPTEQARLEEAQKKFEDVVKISKNHDVGLFAQFYLADIAEKLDKKDDAEKMYAQLSDALGKNDPLRFIALERQAFLLEAKGDIDGALAAINPLVEDQKAFYHHRASLYRSQLLVRKGDIEAARKILEQLDNDKTDASLRGEVRQKLSMLPAKPVPSAGLTP